MEHRGPDFLPAVNLTRTEFLSNQVLEITLWNSFYLQNEKLSPHNNVCNSHFHSSCSKILDMKNIAENYLA